MSEHTYHLIVHPRPSAEYKDQAERYELITSDLATIQAELIIAREGIGGSSLHGIHERVTAYLNGKQVNPDSLNLEVDAIIKQARDALGYE